MVRGGSVGSDERGGRLRDDGRKRRKLHDNLRALKRLVDSVHQLLGRDVETVKVDGAEHARGTEARSVVHAHPLTSDDLLERLFRLLLSGCFGSHR